MCFIEDVVSMIDLVLVVCSKGISVWISKNCVFILICIILENRFSG